jgi:diguanylate cyclase (GGDEF)-like protein/PAS domain S-box-containing protein
MSTVRGLFAVSSAAVTPSRTASRACAPNARKGEPVPASLFEALVMQSSDIAIIFDVVGTIRFVTPSVESLSGYAPEELIGRRGWDFLHPDDATRDMELVVRCLSVGESVTREWRLLRPDGSWGWFELTLSDLTAHPDIRGIVGNLRDVSARHAAFDAVAQSEQLFRSTVELTSDAFLGVDPDDRITVWNAAAEAMFGWSAREAIGQDLCDLLIPEEDRAVYRSLFERAVAGDFPKFVAHPFEMMGMDRTRRTFPCEVCIVYVDIGGRSQFQAFVRDISARKAAEASLAEQALTDPMTRLPNRALLRDRLTRATARLERRASGYVAVLFVDVDRFKLVNDGLGHEAGDEFIVELSERIVGAVRGVDTVARYGGDEFVVIAEDLSHPREANIIAGRIIAAAHEPLLLRGHELKPRVSLGIAVAAAGQSSPESLVRDADVAMYRAKEQGGGQWMTFDEEMGERAKGMLEFEEDLRRAIQRGELILHYQPIVSMGGEIRGAEALVRWDHPTRGLLPPNDFIPVAEATGLVVPLGEWVLETACRQAAAWRSTVAPEVEIFVNVAAQQLADADFADAVGRILVTAGLEPSALCLEITETGLMSDPKAVAASLQRLTPLGVRVAVDDFGTGYGSLMYLRQFPVGVLKLDRFFVAGLTSNAADTVIAESVIRLARSLGLTSIAEGVETVDQRRALETLGCDRAQGWLWAKAQPAPDITPLLAAHRALEADAQPAP